MPRTILLIDDEPLVLNTFEAYFVRHDWKVLRSTGPQEALRLYTTERPSVVLLDVGMPILDGIQLLEILREQDPDPSIIMLTGHAEIETAIDAMKLGAENFLTKPVELHQLLVVVEKAYKKSVQRRENRAFVAREPKEPRGSDPAHSAASLRGMQTQLDRLAQADISVFITGETGTGKSGLARSLHERSPRASGPFVEVNLPSIPGEYFERELFGEERLTTRGSRVEWRGLVEQAHGGTLFLDEVGVLSPEDQPKLLEVLETRRFRRVGGSEELRVDIRVISASNRDLEDEVQGGRFRSDLYFRLAAAPVRLPPARECATSEVVEALRLILRSLPSDRGPRRIDPVAERLLAAYPWPGNYREMRDVLDRILILNPGLHVIEADHLPPEISGPRVPSANGLDPTITLQEAERTLITMALRHFEGNRSRAARSLGISRRALYDKIERLGIGGAESSAG